MTVTLEVRELSKCYRTFRHESLRFASWLGLSFPPEREHWALRDVSFSIEAGQSVGIVGGNGAGKSTLLKIIAGTTAPTCGRVSVSGDSAAVLELGFNFSGDLSGAENVRLCAGMLGLSSADLARLEPDIRAFAEIGDAFDDPVRTYSTGMQARLSFAIATARRPALLILDEVLSVGDAYFQEKSFGRIVEFARAGTSLVFVTHGIESVRQVCERAIWLDAGRVLADDDAASVCDAYAAGRRQHRSSSTTA